MSNILIFGNAPWCPSGYGVQAALLAKKLPGLGHSTAVAAFHGLHGTPLNWEGVKVYPGSGEDPWALDVLPAHYRNYEADLLITLMDIWVLDPAKLAGMSLAHWIPVDCSPLSAMDRAILDKGGGRPVAMSQFGRRQLEDAGYDPLYVPHSLDTAVWSPLEDREQAREILNFSGRFVIGVNAANQDPVRKGFGEQIAAFARFSRKHDDALMLIHSRAETRQGADLNALIAHHGVSGKVILGDQYMIAAGLVSEAQMTSWHGVLDVLSNCAYGEGFGLAVLQSQAAGVPVIVTDGSSMTELCGAGWAVESQPFWNRGHNAEWRAPLIGSIADAYEEAYQHAGELRGKAREFALRYDADRVLQDYWAPALKELLPGG